MIKILLVMSAWVFLFTAQSDPHRPQPWKGVQDHWRQLPVKVHKVTSGERAVQVSERLSSDAPSAQ